MENTLKMAYLRKKKSFEGDTLVWVFYFLEKLRGTLYPLS
jgi:hypothetical protein